ncbi:hypothetical protein HK101_001205, partial [Irineochytrium annulatum]
DVNARGKGVKDVGDHIVSDDGAQEWRILRQIGKGGCGEVFLGREVHAVTANAEQGDGVVAVKFIRDQKQFLNEVRTMKLLNAKMPRGVSPRLLYASKKRRAVVMEYLSDSLANQFEQRGCYFSLKTVIMLSMEMLRLSKEFYDKTNMVHVDIKPSNFCIGRTGRDLHLIDFGYATKPTTALPGQTGTPLFMAVSIQANGAICPCWTDDLESIGYCIMFFLAGGKQNLPWGHLRTHADIVLAKSDTAIEDFCLRYLEPHPAYHPIALPLLFYMNAVRNRRGENGAAGGFDPHRSYGFLMGLFRGIMECYGMENDGRFDWGISGELQSRAQLSLSVGRYSYHL